LILGFALACALLAGACSRSDPERELRAAVGKLQESVQARDLSALMMHVTDDFASDTGALDKKALQRMMGALFLTNQKIVVVATIDDIKISGKVAETKLSVLATGGESFIPQRAQGWDFFVRWRYEGGKWQVMQAQWKEKS
jgi:ketosteroid isomerase-like protein